jgi:hypothetical protein
VPQESLEHGLDRGRPAQHPLDPRAAAAGAQDDEVAERGVARALAVDDERDAALEVRLADEKLSPAGQLADDQLGAANRAWP